MFYGTSYFYPRRRNMLNKTNFSTKADFRLFFFFLRPAFDLDRLDQAYYLEYISIFNIYNLGWSWLCQGELCQTCCGCQHLQGDLQSNIFTFISHWKGLCFTLSQSGGYGSGGDIPNSWNLHFFWINQLFRVDIGLRHHFPDQDIPI